MTIIHRVPDYTYPDCTVLNWVDGDTLDMQARAHFDGTFTVDPGFKFQVTAHTTITTEFTGRFRLHGVDAYEKRDLPLGPEATAFAQGYMPVGSAVSAKTYKDPDNFGRYLAILWLPESPDITLNGELLEVHLAVPMSGRQG
jgi:endonuclease YncB( thermonuclease family)